RTTGTHYFTIKSRVNAAVFFFFLTAVIAVTPCLGQDWIKTGTGLGMEKVRLAVPNFKPSTADPKNAELLNVFDGTLWNDLDNAGIFDMVSKSFYPLAVPGTPTEVQFASWSALPPNAAMLAFGNLGVTGGNVTVQGWLYDVKNTASPQVLGKQYQDSATTDAARLIAHKFADEIIFRLGGGIPGIAESQIYFVSSRTGHKEIWVMDYDGANQRQITHLNSISLSPRISPDGSRLAFSSMTKSGWEILMYSTDLNRLVSFPRFGGTNLSPAWSSDGTKLAFSSSRSGDPEIYTVDQSGGTLKRVTSFKGPDVSPVWNRKTNAQIAWVSGRTGLPQIYTMEADGTNVQRLTDQGYAVSPAWSPNGQFLAFAWIRHYGPGAPGASDIYLMDVASKQWVQLTHDGGRNDFPSWSPDGRHLVFQSSRAGGEQIWEMLADGSNQKQLTTNGSNTQPNWSWK
ncbi:MAG TPA: Tol-Pal system beta propeller repeat protein TolB, partial [Candidatus Acidoferrales bacterium]|nr:Tol-Pal system beta propeller repeat protein TolB [Candidatus Acidoferrales bacterium]